MIYETNKYAFNFQESEIIRSFGENTLHGKIRLDEADK